MRLWDFGSGESNYMMFSVAGGDPAAPILLYEACKADIKQGTVTAGNYAVTNTW
jgi:hypothetical protein